MEIPQKHYRGTVIKKTSLNFILILIRSIRNTGKNIFLLLDYDSDDYLEISGDYLEKSDVRNMISDIINMRIG